MSAAATPRTQSVRDLCRDAFRTETRGIDWRSGLAGALAAAGPLAIGYAAGDTVIGLTAGIGGLNTALVIPRAGPRSRAWWGVLCALSAMASFALASVVNDHTWSLVAATFVWVLGWAFLRAVGPTGALAGFATCAVFVVIAGLPAGGPGLGIKLLWFAAGCAVGFGLMVAARRGPELSAHPAADSVRVVARALRHDRALAGHALRLAVAVAAGTLLYRLLDMPHGYWIPLTTLAILQPGEHATHVRALQRAIGTLGGAALIILITLTTGETSVLIACAAASAFWLYALDARGYFWLVVMLTPTVLLMLSVVDFTGDAIGVERVANSAVGIVIGLAIGELVWRLAARRALPPG